MKGKEEKGRIGDKDKLKNRIPFTALRTPIG
jgi:hypothetical protein